MPGKNIGIAQPRSNPSWGATPHNRVAVTQGNFTFQRANSTMNSYFTSGSFGAPNSQNRKQRVYNQTPINSFALFSRRQKKHGVRSTSQQNVEAQVGQMDRLARIKAHAIKSSKPNPPPVYVTVNTATVGNNNQIVDGNDFWGTSGTNISFVETYDVRVGDTVVFSKTGVIPETTVTVESILSSGVPHNRKFRIITTPAHNISVNVENVTVKIIDRS